LSHRGPDAGNKEVHAIRGSKSKKEKNGREETKNGFGDCSSPDDSSLYRKKVLYKKY